MIIEAECTLLNLLHWDITVITPAHFLGLFLPYSVMDSDTIEGREIKHKELMYRNVCRLSNFYVELCRQGTLRFY